MLTVKETAKLLLVSEKTVYRWISAGKIPYTKIGDQYRFSRQELQTWVAASKRSPSPEIMAEPKLSDAELPSLLDAVTDGGIHYCVDGKTPADVIKEIISIVHLPQGIDSEYIRESILARESMASTGMGYGFAVPHMRNPVANIAKSTVTLCFLKNPVDWNSLDKKPVSVVFLPCCQTMQIHLYLLSRISFVSRIPEFRDLLHKQASRGEILKSLAEIENME